MLCSTILCCTMIIIFNLFTQHSSSKFFISSKFIKCTRKHSGKCDDLQNINLLMMSIIIGERWHIPVYSFFLQEKKTSRRKRFFSLSCRFSNSSPATAKYSKKNKKDVHCFIFSTCFTENYSCVLLYYFYMTRQTFFIHPFKKIIQKACSILKIIITDPPFKKSILLLYIATDAASSATAITIMDVERWFISRKIKKWMNMARKRKIGCRELVKDVHSTNTTRKGKRKRRQIFFILWAFNDHLRLKLIFYLKVIFYAMLSMLLV